MMLLMKIDPDVVVMLAAVVVGVVLGIIGAVNDRGSNYEHD